MNENENEGQISQHLYLKVFTYLKEVRTHSVGAFHFGKFYGLSTWDFDLHLLDQASLSKLVAYESVDRFVTYTWTCQNVSLSVSRAYCHKHKKLLPPPHLSLFILPLWSEITNDQACRYFQQGSRFQEPKGLTHMPVWKYAHPWPDVDTFGFSGNAWNAGCFQIYCIYFSNVDPEATIV